MLMAPLVTAGVNADVAQELQMPIGPEALDMKKSQCDLVQPRSKILALLTISCWVNTT